MKQIIKALADIGGKSFLVGGAVRDKIMGLGPKDFDVEVFNLSYDEIRGVLERFGKVDLVGKSFGVLKMGDYDFSIPRTEIKNGVKHTDFKIKFTNDLVTASRRRDLTINSIYYDIELDEYIDPWNGIEDIKNKVLHFNTAETFVEDPLRFLRVMQFASRFQFTVSRQLSEVVKANLHTLHDLPKERIFDELKKLLLQSKKPSIGLNWAKEVGIVQTLWPELDILSMCQQRAKWHQEGDVWIHTMLVIDEAAKLNLGLLGMLACLCHDLGKPSTTTPDLRALGHEAAGVPITKELLSRLTSETKLINQVLPLVGHHLKPAQFWPKAGNAAIRRLSLKVDIPMLCQVAKADKLGRISEDLSLEFVDWMLDKYKNLVEDDPIGTQPILKGKHLIEMGMTPSPEFGIILNNAFQAQLDDVFKTVNEGKQWVKENL